MKKILITVLFIIITPGVMAGNVNVIGGATREHTVRPGEKTEGRIMLRNYSDSPARARLYQRDYIFWADGRAEYGDPGGLERSNAPWIEFTPVELTVPAEGYEYISYTVEVPENDGLTGSYWSVLMVEPAREDIDPVAVGERVGVRIRTRQAIQMVTHIGETGERRLRFSDRRLVSGDGERHLRIDVENTGQRYLRPTVWMEVYDTEGVALGRFEGGRRRIYPECSTRIKIDVSELPPGRYQAMVVADAGEEDVFGARYELEIKE